MVDADDVQRYATKFSNQLDKLADADVPEADRTAIREFVLHVRANEDLSTGTLVGHLNRLRLASERAAVPLTDMAKVDVDALVVTLEDEHGLSEGSLRNYRKSLRRFFRWRGEPWADDVKVGSPPDRKHDPSRELSRDEVDAMLDAARRARDKALVALLDDTGLRIGAVLSFQLRHLSIDGPKATVTINDDANVKGDDGPKPLTWSRGYVANWLDVHPRPDDPDAALVHKLRRFEDDEDGALTQQYASRLLKRIGERAGIDPDRVQAHLFRSSAISRWIRGGLGDQAIKHRAGWSKDSRMFQVYSRVQDEEMNDVVFDHYGIEGETEPTRPELDRCTQCRTPLRGSERFCPGCATPLSPGAFESVEAVEDATFESIRRSDRSNEQLFAEFRRRFKSDPSFRQRVVGDD